MTVSPLEREALRVLACHCAGSQGGFGLDDEPTSDYYRMWVHAACGKPTLLYLEGELQEAAAGVQSAST